MNNATPRNDYAELTLPKLVGDTGLFVDGDWIESKDQDPNGDVRLIQLMDIGDGEYLDKSNRFHTSNKAEELRCTFMRPGDVLVSRMPDPLGRACIFPGDAKPCVTAVDVCIVRPDPTIADSRWVKYMINSPRFRSQIGRWAAGTTRERISRGNLAKILFLLPPLPEQRRIVAILDKADAIRSKREEGIRLTEELLRSTFLELFGDPATNPKGWPIRSMTDVVQETQYGTAAKSNADRVGLPILRMNNITYKGNLDLSDLKWCEISDEERPQYTVRKGDLLFNRTNDLNWSAKRRCGTEKTPML